MAVDGPVFLREVKNEHGQNVHIPFGKDGAPVPQNEREAERLARDAKPENPQDVLVGFYYLGQYIVLK